MTQSNPIRVAILGSALIAVTYGLARFIFGLFLPEIRAALGISASVAGWMIDSWGYDTMFGVFGAVGLLAALLSFTFPCMRELRYCKEKV